MECYHRHILIFSLSSNFIFVHICLQRGLCMRRLAERPEQHIRSRFKSWVVLSRTVQPENGDYRLNLRFVSPWNANSPQQSMRRNTKKSPNLPGPCWNLVPASRFWITCWGRWQSQALRLFIAWLKTEKHKDPSCFLNSTGILQSNSKETPY